ncbi:hypothetical protein PRIPAC_81787 [Pristionchus pacificus]|uniref:Uncharacterized protein n=1 Tax=Pristionchus pacificus TaxID=54126 RepID=A0A454XW78_PRIPA|nr:hypothetical protein PRIPAC_81787 [Pristionchus pacificus]|eukprot:PDM78390.1 hypothetical protein PRIPAC_30969 [Pristionchus pacificus]
MCEAPQITQEMLDKFNQGREAVKANPEIVDASIAKLSPGAREVATKLRDLVCSDEQDIGAFQAKLDGIQGGLSDEVKAELEAHNAEVAAAIGLPTA